MSKRSASVPVDIERIAKKPRPVSPTPVEVAASGGYKCNICRTRVTDLNAVKCISSIMERYCADCHECDEMCKDGASESNSEDDDDALEEFECITCGGPLGKHEHDVCRGCAEEEDEEESESEGE